MATLETQQLDEIIVNSRRKMLTLGGAALAGLAFPSAAKAQAAAAITDADVLNFALNLEYLEANFYTLAVSGQTIDMQGISITGGQSAGGTVTTKAGGPASCKVPFANPLVKAYATETAQEERNHVAFLSKTLAAGAVAQPNLDLFNSFNGLAALLNLTPKLTAFDPFADDASFLLGAYIFEDVGVTAYTGGAPLLTTPAYLDAAAGIQGVEAYHAGLIRTTIYGLDSDPAGTTLGKSGTLSAIATAISALRASVDGSGSTNANNLQGDDIGIGQQQVQLNGTTNVTASTLVNANTTGSINTAVPAGSKVPALGNSLTFVRTTAQVLPIVYANGTGKGGFFPNGLNGTIK